MQIVYRVTNAFLIVIGTLFSMFLSWAGIGTREGIRQAIAANPYRIFFGRLAFATLIMLFYSVAVYGINRIVFHKTSHPGKVFQVSMGIYFMVIALFVYLFVRIP